MAKRIFAMLLILLLLALFAATLITGVVGGPEQLPLLKALIFCDVVVPAVIYGYLLISRRKK